MNIILSIMKYTSLDIFKNHIRALEPNDFSSVYLLLSEDLFTRKQFLDVITATIFKNESSSRLCTQTYDAERHSINQIQQELETLNFFSKKRVVIVHNAEAFDKASTTKLENYFNNPNQSICLILLATTINRATTFYKKADKLGVVVDIPEEKPWEKEKNMAAWLRSEATNSNKELSLAGAQLLVKQLGTNQLLLQNELHKLICYVDQRPKILESDISMICSTVTHDNAWQLGEAIFARDAKSALSIARALLNEGTPFIALLRQIRTQFQTKFQICSMLCCGKTPADIAQEYSYMKGNILDKNISLSQSYGMSRFKKGLIAIDKTELQAKNSGLENELLADMLIVTLTT